MRLTIELKSDGEPISGFVELYIDDVYWKTVFVDNGYYEEEAVIVGRKIKAVFRETDDYERAEAEAYIPALLRVRLIIELRSNGEPISGFVELYVDDVYWKTVFVESGYYEEITEIYGYKIKAIFRETDDYEGAETEVYIPVLVKLVRDFDVGFGYDLALILIAPKADVGVGREELLLIKIIPSVYPLTDWKRELCRRVVYMCSVNRVVDEWTWLFYVYRERYRFYKDRKVSAFIRSLMNTVYYMLSLMGYLKPIDGRKRYLVVRVPRFEIVEEIVQTQVVDIVRS